MIACVRVPGLPTQEGRIQALLEALSQFTPLVEAEASLELRADARKRRQHGYAVTGTQVDETPAAVCYLDLGPMREEQGLEVACSIHRALMERHLPSAFGLASGKFPARTAARMATTNHVTIVAKGKEATFLAPLPTGLLPVDGETLRQLDLLGLRTLGQIAALPPAAIRDRFGPQGRLMHRLANGRDTSPVGRYEAALEEQLCRPFDPPLDNRDLLHHNLTALVKELAVRLQARHQAAQKIALTLQLEDGTSVENHIVLKRPDHSMLHLTRAALDLLAATPVHTRVQALDVRLSHVVPLLAQQLSLFEREPVKHAQLQELLKMLAQRYGDCFFWAALTYPDADLPEQRYRLVPAGEE